MRKILKYLTVLFIALSFTNCEDSNEPLNINYVSFEGNSFDVGVDEGSETSTNIKVYTANITNSDRVVGISVVEEGTNLDASAYTVPETITIPAGTNEAILTVNIKDVGLSLLDQMLEVKLVQTEDILVGKTLKIAAALNCPGEDKKIKINIDFDSYPEEAAWRILDANDNTVMASSSPFGFGAYDGFSESTSIPECLPSGDYTIEVYDGYKDGGTAYSITVDGSPVLAIEADEYEDFFSTTISF
uniref:DUF1735 domain-containing protein n=1 Tax=uncultured Tenacibaculum sp. TaxID=174713 RepID=UPI002635337E|nr:DUF1735 domain-containing protein [uncultured Tenacibaculum sp.]